MKQEEKNYIHIIEILRIDFKKGLELLYLNYGKGFIWLGKDKWNLSEDDSLDITYNTLEKLSKKLNNISFKSQKHFDNYVYKAFKNEVLQHFRSVSKEVEWEVFEMEDIEWMASNEVGQLTKNLEEDYLESLNRTKDTPLMKVMKDALQQCSPVERDLLLLRAQNFTYKEIASLLKVDDKNLKVKYHRAKKKLIQFVNKVDNLNNIKNEEK